MKTFRIEFTWTMCGTYIVEAKNEEEALKLAKDLPLPTGEYLDGSYHPDFMCEENSGGLMVKGTEKEL